MRKLAGTSALEYRLWDPVSLSGLLQASKNTRFKITDSSLYSNLTRIHIEYSVVGIYGFKNGVLILVGWPKTICGRKLYGLAYPTWTGSVANLACDLACASRAGGALRDSWGQRPAIPRLETRARSLAIGGSVISYVYTSV